MFCEQKKSTSALLLASACIRHHDQITIHMYDIVLSFDHPITMIVSPVQLVALFFSPIYFAFGQAWMLKFLLANFCYPHAL